MKKMVMAIAVTAALIASCKGEKRENRSKRRSKSRESSGR